MLSKKAVLLGIGFSLVLIFGMLNAIGIIPGLTYSSDGTVIFDGISKNPFQVYEINTVCELADLVLENHFDYFQSHNEDFEKQLPAEWNERMSVLAAKEKFWKEISDQQKNLGSRYLTAEEDNIITELENREKLLYYTMIMKYFSVNPELEGEFLALYEYFPLSLVWLKDKHPECMPLLEEKYG